MSYSHTQSAPLHYVIELVAVAALVAVWFARGDSVVQVTLLVFAAVALLLAFSFQTLTVSDEGDSLSLRYGPLPLFSKRFDYAKIQSVAAGRSSWIDGWGIHWVPGRGWTYNLWGFDCAVLNVAGKTVRVGSDDVAQLVEMISGKIHARAT